MAGRARVRGFLVAISLLGFLGLVPTPASANPGVPYCLGSVNPLATVPTVALPEVCESVTGRVFPEAVARPEYVAEGNRAFATDFVSFPEFEAGLKYLESQYPDKVAVRQVSQSYGLRPAPAAGLDKFPIYLVEVTNEKSPIPAEQRLKLLFMLSIHGNEKGGREGGMRVLEDLAAGRGLAKAVVQNGAGMPTPLTKPGGGNVQTYADYLDFMRLFFLFPNVDGWMHDELPYVSQPMCVTLFCRTNGNGTDLNRQMPTIGWQFVNANSGRLAVNEPEAKGYLKALVELKPWAYAIDIHGMLSHENFVAIMMPAGSFSPQEMQRSTRLAEALKERLNGDDHFGAWKTVLGAGEQAGAPLGNTIRDPVCSVWPQNAPAGCLFPSGSPTKLVGSGEFSDWSTVWDAIGYTDSGFSGDFFAQSTGLNAPGYDIELAYNHITFDSQYEIGALFNDYHVHAVRHIVKSFLDAASLDVTVSYDTKGTKTLVLESPYVATNADDARATAGGWADANPHDDYWQYSDQNPLRARPAKYWTDLQPFLKDGDKPGVLTMANAGRLTRDVLDEHDTLVIPGSAINQLVRGPAKSNMVPTGPVDEARVNLILDWVRAGGNLVLTDAALEFFDLAQLTTEAVDVAMGYAGAVNLDRAHELAKDVRGEARQTYEPVPLGFQVGFNSPIWGIKRSAFDALKGDVAGTGYRGSDVSLGRLSLGEGRIQFIGALLPDPSEEYYHPYGLDDYATTYSGNQILRNMLGWTAVFAAPPVVINERGQIEQSPNEPQGLGAGGLPRAASPLDAGDEGSTPGLGWVAALAVLSWVALRRRPTRP